MMEFIIGFFTGLTASLGLGGGFVLIIYLLVFTQTTQIKAQGMNLVFFLPIALISMILHTRNKLVSWKTVPVFCGFGVLGVGIGFWLSRLVNERILSKVFAVLLLVVGAKELFHKKTVKVAEK